MVGQVAEHPGQGYLGLGSLNEGDRIADQFGAQKIHGQAAISANRTAPSSRTVSVSKTRGMAISPFRF